MKRFAVVIAWVAATFATGAVAWAVVGLAGESLTESAVVPLSAQQIDDLAATLPDPSAAVVVSDSSTTTVPSTSTTAVPVTTGTPSETSTTTGPVASTSTQPASAATTTTTTTSTLPPGDDDEDGEEDGGDDDPVVEAYPVTGGTVVIRYTPSWIELVSATPDQGYSVEIESAGPERVVVEFDGEGHEIKFEAEVIGGEVVTRIDVDD